ncbi:uncharacterized protein LOC107046524 [Diachasma alloeum]|uniref:uncharacterized protein LOC107046524 n=1 Tax=Diachasma alloeum TaxID=454923 RepID=UPI00073840CB|nr:uncharacterized protein LOC107046524 [Diachasma alloeum]
MVLPCSFPNCKGKSRFRFPSKCPQTRQKWLDFIGIQDVKSNKGLCKNHFTSDQFIVESELSGEKLIRKRLKTNAVPTIKFLEKEEHLKGQGITVLDSSHVHPHNSLVSRLSLGSPGKRVRSESLEMGENADKIKRINDVLEGSVCRDQKGNVFLIVADNDITKISISLIIL